MCIRDRYSVAPLCIGWHITAVVDLFDVIPSRNEALAEEESRGQGEILAGRPHRDGEGSLLSPAAFDVADADLQRFFDRELVGDALPGAVVKAMDVVIQLAGVPVQVRFLRLASLARPAGRFRYARTPPIGRPCPSRRRFGRARPTRGHSPARGPASGGGPLRIRARAVSYTHLTLPTSDLV